MFDVAGAQLVLLSGGEQLSDHLPDRYRFDLGGMLFQVVLHCAGYRNAAQSAPGGRELGCGHFDGCIETREQFNRAEIGGPVGTAKSQDVGTGAGEPGHHEVGLLFGEFKTGERGAVAFSVQVIGKRERITPTGGGLVDLDRDRALFDLHRKRDRFHR